jgi:glycine/D-amino acid oxidase-like deaminating enzyme
MDTDETEVLVIGAGLAGLRCATDLVAAGRDVRVLEAGDDVGGRIRTDVIDGFRCDRGFQVLNPAYPEVRRSIDTDSLALQPFGAGVCVRRERGSAVLAHPLRQPGRVPAMLASGAVRPAAVLGVARWALPALRAAALTAPGDDDVTLRAALDRAGMRGELRRVIEGFLAGVLLDDGGATSNAFTLLLVRMFALGVPGLPADGMAALPRQLAAPLGDRVGLHRRVTRIARDGSDWLVSADGEAIRTRQVVVAADPKSAAALTAGDPPAMRGVVTDWWATDEPPSGPAMLWVDGRAPQRGPVVNTAVISAAAPTYAPRGRHLIAASALIGPDRATPSQAEMSAHAGAILGVDASGWELVVRHVVPDALPVQPPPLVVRRPIHEPSGVWVCGDHRDTASIQGALVSGRRTAAAILDTMRARRAVAG